jgi:hypothetical protein
MSWTPQEEQEFLAKRRKRNLVIGLVLGAFAFLFYGITISRIAG